MHKIQIASTEIGQGCKPFIVAELSGNHQQDFQLAKTMIAEAAKSGVDAIKLQTYTADTMTLDSYQDEFFITEKDSLWHGESLYSLYQKAATPWEWHKPLFDYAKSLGLIAFSSPFDHSAVDFLESLAVPCYKIASFENNDIPLIKRIAQTGKPIILSTGMASFDEIQEAVETIRKEGNQQIVLLKCTSTYPADVADSNLMTIADLQTSFGCVAGLSDHTKGIGVAIAAVALGACFIEKHIVIDRNAGGVDAEFSLEPNEWKHLVAESQNVFKAIGEVSYGGSKNEQTAKNYRRSIYVSQNLNAGEALTENNLRIIRPGFGLEPKFYQQVLGKKVKLDVSSGTPLHWSLLDI